MITGKKRTIILDICVNSYRFLSHVDLMTCMNIKCQWKIIMGKKTYTV